MDTKTLYLKNNQAFYKLVIYQSNPNISIPNCIPYDLTFTYLNEEIGEYKPRAGYGNLSYAEMVYNNFVTKEMT